MTGERRGPAARAGIGLINLLGPGLGLLRAGEGRLALAFLIAPSALLLLMILLYVAVPDFGFYPYAIATVAFLVAVAVLFVASMIFTWRRSASLLPPPRPWWSRWFGLLIALIGTQAAVTGLVSLAHGFYKPFYIPSEGMSPTLVKGDRLLARMGITEMPARGDVIILRVGRHDYVKRVAALPGDTIGMVRGRVVLNGREVPQRVVGSERMTRSYLPTAATVLAEQFPGEPAPHRVYDTGPSDYDDYLPVRVRPGHIFVLGDNRDMSADSRVPRSRDGVEQARVTDIRGRVLFVTWGPDGRRSIDISRDR